MAKYAKFITALVGALLVGVDQFLGISLSFNAEQIMAFLIPLLTAVGVWQIPNRHGGGGGP